MSKLKRELDLEIVEQAKERSINAVMMEISIPSRKPLIKAILKPTLVPLFTVLLILAIALSPRTTTDNPTIINAFESQKYAEITYLSASLIESTTTISTGNIVKLGFLDLTEFEDNEELINLYFDTLKVFLEEDNFLSNTTITTLDNHEFQTLISFEENSVTYNFYITIDEDGVIEGLLVINDITYQVEGTTEEDKESLKIELQAKKGSDYITIEYETENKEEQEIKYQIQTSINGVETNKEVKVSKENDESKVEITEGANEYELKKELEDGQYKYKLQYKINEIEGEAIITEEIDSNGLVQYQYQIKEGNEEKIIDKNKPDHSYDDDSDDDSEEDKGNEDKPENNEDSEEDEEDSDDDKGNNGNGNSQNQSSKKPLSDLISTI